MYPSCCMSRATSVRKRTNSSATQMTYWRGSHERACLTFPRRLVRGVFLLPGLLVNILRRSSVHSDHEGNKRTIWHASSWLPLHAPLRLLLRRQSLRSVGFNCAQGAGSLQRFLSVARQRNPVDTAPEQGRNRCLKVPIGTCRQNRFCRYAGCHPYCIAEYLVRSHHHTRVSWRQAIFGRSPVAWAQGSKRRIGNLTPMRDQTARPHDHGIEQTLHKSSLRQSVPRPPKAR